MKKISLMDIKTKRYQSGVSLIEILVAVCIVAFGLLGMAGLQVSSLRYQKTAQSRNFATLYTTDIADRMRANMEEVYKGGYNDTNYNTIPSNCDDAETVSEYDICMWRMSLNNATAGWGQLELVSGGQTEEAPAVYKITVMITEPGEDIPENESGCASTITRPNNKVRCFSTEITP